MILCNFWASDFSKRSVFSFKADEKTAVWLEEIRHKKIIIATRVGTWNFFSGGYLYKDGGKVFKVDNVCYSIEERYQADYLLEFNDVVKSIDSELKRRYSNEECFDNLEFLSVIKLSQDLAFDLYKIVK